MRVKYPAKWNNGSLWWRSNRRVTDNEAGALPTVSRCSFHINSVFVVQNWPRDQYPLMIRLGILLYIFLFSLFSLFPFFLFIFPLSPFLFVSIHLFCSLWSYCLFVSIYITLYYDHVLCYVLVSKWNLLLFCTMISKTPFTCVCTECSTN